jgi:hemerythrin-like domain-containing protein
MTPVAPLLRDEAFLEEHRRIHQRLLRLQKFSAPDSGFPNSLSALVACVDEIENLLPELSEHFSKEEKVFRSAPVEEHPSEQLQRAEQVLGEHQPLLREMRALLESGREVVEELRSRAEAGSMAEALKAYLSACVRDLLEHEEKEKQFLTAQA